MATGARTGPRELTGTTALQRGIPPGARGGIQILGMVPRQDCLDDDVCISYDFVMGSQVLQTLL